MAYSDIILADGPVAYWELAEVSGTVAADSAGTYAGEYFNTPTLGAAEILPAGSGTSVSFDGSSQYMHAAAPASIAGAAAATIEAWIKTNTSSETAMNIVLVGPGPGSGDVLYFALDSHSGLYGRFRLGLGGGYRAASSVDLRDGVAHHIVATIPENGTIDDIKLYIDGLRLDDASSNGTLAKNTYLDSGTDIAVYNATSYNAAPPERYFSGSVAQVAIYAAELTPQQIAAHHAWGRYEGYKRAVMASAPVAYWRLGETTGTVAADEMGSHDAAYVNAPTLGATGLLAGDTDKAVGLNGVDQYVVLNDENFRSGDNSGSIEAWYKSSVAAYQSIACIASTTTNFALTLDVSAAGFVRIGENISAGAWDTVEAQAVNVQDGEPHHIVVISDGTNWSIYIDGEDQTLAIVSGSNTGTWIADEASFDNLAIGIRNRIAQDAPLNGIVDEVAVYDHALTPAEIADHFVAGTTSGTYSLAGNVLTSAGAAADFVAVFEWPDGARVSVTTPAADGSWGVNVDPGDYGITYLATGCQPITHGPYTVE